mmetsp:Transcript_502/g.1484  ORF Transcript_502/g.1484 Transcript_502/m.1484 type:complete len:248 (+) Transcript_502:306-1049(+)
MPCALIAVAACSSALAGESPPLGKLGTPSETSNIRLEADRGRVFSSLWHARSPAAASVPAFIALMAPTFRMKASVLLFRLGANTVTSDENATAANRLAPLERRCSALATLAVNVCACTNWAGATELLLSTATHTLDAHLPLNRGMVLPTGQTDLMMLGPRVKRSRLPYGAKNKLADDSDLSRDAAKSAAVARGYFVPTTTTVCPLKRAFLAAARAAEAPLSRLSGREGFPLVVTMMTRRREVANRSR